LFRRFIKALFSRFVTVGLLIIMQVAWIGVMFTILSEHYLIIRIASIVLSVIIALYILNKQEVPEYKLPWMLVVIAFPPFGIIVFLAFGSNRPGRILKKKYQRIDEESKKHLTQSRENMALLQNISPVAHGQAEYLHKSSGACLRLEGETDYFPMGEDMFPVLVEELKKAKHFIFMEYFIVEEGKFWNTILDVLKEKVNEGVEVRFMYDDVGSIGKVSVAYAKKLCKLGIHAQAFRPFRPFVSVMHNNRDHRKITVIDNEVAFTGGVNLADEYINEVERFGRWKDNSVMMKGEVVKDFTNMFLTLWDLQAGVVSNYRKYTAYPQYPHEEPHKKGFVCAYGDGPKPMYMEQVGKNVYLNILNSATEYVYITTPYLVCDNELLSAIRHAAERGVDVRMITPHIPDKKSVYMITRSNYGILMEGGVKIYEYTPGFIHAKTFVSDDKYAVVSTINLDYRSLVHHYECGLWMYGTDTVQKVKADLLSTMAESHEVSCEEAKLNLPQELLKSILQIFTPLL
jgi:cardiolipin synthase